jgi:DNA-binding transcriptional ArsR family regulator
MGDTAAVAVLIADRTRVRIIDALRVGPLRTVELAGATGMSAAALSRHLNLLREARLVERFDVAGDGRGRSYRLQPAALDGLAGWIRSTAWSAELAAGSTRPKTQELLANIGGFLDAFAANDVDFFQTHLRPDAVLVFPGMAPIGKQACVDSVRSHAPYRCHTILDEPTVQPIGAGAAVITMTVDVAAVADNTSHPTIVTAVIEDGDPWQLAHLQWTPTAPTNPEGNSPS